MAGRLALDTSHLIAQWNRRSGRRPIEGLRSEDVRSWADELIDLHRARWICTPIRIEFLCNTNGNVALLRARDYLDRFSVIDGGNILAEDWVLAERFAPRRASDVKSTRSLGDCLIAAIYRRFRLALIPTPDVDKDLFRRTRSSGPPNTERS